MKNFLFALYFTLVLLLPDFIADIFWHGFYEINPYRTPKELIATFLIGLLLSFAPKIFTTTVTSIFLLFSFISIGFYAYFHNYLMPFDLGILQNSDDVKDIFYSLKDIAGLVIILLVLWGAFTFITYFVLKKLNPKSKKFAVPLFLAALIIYPYFINKKTNIYLANFTHFSWFNTLNTIYLAGLKALKPHPHHNYKPYIVKKTDSGKPIVIMIMGESMNERYMHLFGWQDKNTPLLDTLKNDPHFIYKKAISCSVRTICSVTTFFYNKREPDNISLITKNYTNIMKLADENGYNTYWLSMQSDVSLISNIFNFAKHRKFVWQFKRQYDNELINELKKIPFNKKTFVVLHLKADHSPYLKYVPEKFYKFTPKDSKIWAYDNAILYTDYVIYNVIDYMKKHHKNFVIYFTSDHGEMMGYPWEGGRRGHSQLVWGDTYVPFLYYSDTYEKNLTKPIYNHYQISKMLTRDLGYKIVNANENGSYFVNGVNIDGSAGWIEYNLTNKLPPKIIKKVVY